MTNKGVFFYQTQAKRHQLDANLATNTNIYNHALRMKERAEFALEMLERGDTEEQAWKFYQTGEFC